MKISFLGTGTTSSRIAAGKFRKCEAGEQRVNTAAAVAQKAIWFFKGLLR